ncbi:MAG: hypothetical protein ACLGPL_05745 [Acidobacteriota bacterium]
MDKIELVQRMEEKGISVADAAAKMEFNAELLGLYLAKDSQPIPTRIVKKLEEAIN